MFPPVRVTRGPVMPVSPCLGLVPQGRRAAHKAHGITHRAHGSASDRRSGVATPPPPARLPLSRLRTSEEGADAALDGGAGRTPQRHKLWSHGSDSDNSAEHSADHSSDRTSDSSAGGSGSGTPRHGASPARRMHHRNLEAAARQLPGGAGGRRRHSAARAAAKAEMHDLRRRCTSLQLQTVGLTCLPTIC